jgi:hypothetical protein
MRCQKCVVGRTPHGDACASTSCSACSPYFVHLTRAYPPTVRLSNSREEPANKKHELCNAFAERAV